MAKVVPFPSSQYESYRRAAHTIREQIESLEDVLIGLAALRDLGSTAVESVDSVMEVFELKRLRLSWELLDALMQGDGLDFDALIEASVDPTLLRVTRQALLDEWVSE